MAEVVIRSDLFLNLSGNNPKKFITKIDSKVSKMQDVIINQMKIVHWLAPEGG
jgi:hypothetical protein